jgi:hypothetical protein
MNINVKILTAALCILVLSASCEEWLDINKDPNNPDEANEELTLAAGISSVAYVYGGRYQVLGALWSQHWTQSLGASQYSGLDSYDISSSTFDNRQFGEMYTGALMNLDYIKTISKENGNWNYYLMAEVMQSYTFQILADLYDQIPFSEALKGDDGLITPKYENGQDIYDSLVARIDYALSLDYDKDGLEDVEAEDILFNGRTDKWVEFANTLKLKIYLRQLYERPEAAKEGIESLYAQDAKFLTADAAMTQFTNETGRRNPLYETEVVFLGNNPNLVISNTLLSFMNDKGDLERLDMLFDFPERGGGHKGLDQGDYNDPDEPKGTNSSSYSKPYMSPFAPVYLMSASEAYFIQTEAIIRYGVKPYSEAKEMYENGIDKSFQRLGLIDGEDFYGPGDIYEFPAEGSPLESFIESIIVQKWIALANIQSLETFFEHNRTHYPKESPVQADNSNYVAGEFTVSVNNVTSGRFPKRLLFPESEYSGNPDNTPPKEGVNVYDKIWWDKKEE